MEFQRIRREVREVDELAALCQPIVDYIMRIYNPHTEVIVTMDSITVKQSIEGIPIGDRSD